MAPLPGPARTRSIRRPEDAWRSPARSSSHLGRRNIRHVSGVSSAATPKESRCQRQRGNATCAGQSTSRFGGSDVSSPTWSWPAGCSREASERLPMRHLVTLLALLALATPAFARGEKAAEKKAAGGSGSIHIGENLGIQLDGVVRRGKKLEVKGHLWRPGGHALELDGVRRYQMKGTSMIVEKPRLLRTLLHAE